MAAPNKPVGYAQHLLTLFTDVDIDHMNNVGLDLTDYQVVRDNADLILKRLDHDTKYMPPLPNGPWPVEWINLFRRWIAEGKQP